MPAGVVNDNDAVHLVKLEQTATRLGSLAASSLAPIVGAEHALHLDNFAVEIIATAKELRDEPLGAEEGREQRVKNLIERKRRAWRDLLNELKRVGISPSPAPKVVARLEDAGAVYSLTPSHALLALDQATVGGDVHPRVVKADAYHYRQLAELPTLKTFPAAHHADVRTPDVQRALGHIQSGIHLTFDQRSLLLAASATQVQLELVVKRLEGVTGVQPALPARQLLDSLLTATSTTLHALGEARDELANYRSANAGASSADAARPSEVVDEALATVGRDQSRLRDALSAMAGYEPVLVTADELKLAEEAREHLVTVAETFGNLAQPASLRYLLAPLTVFLGSVGVPSVEPQHLVGETSDLTTLKAAHDDVVSAVLVIAQNLKKVAVEGVQVADNDELVDGAVGVAGRSYRSLFATFRLDEMVIKAEQFALDAHVVLSQPQQVRPSPWSFLS